jgi:hypothetical protein
MAGELYSVLGGTSAPPLGGAAASTSDYDKFAASEKERSQKLEQSAKELGTDLDKSAEERKAASFDFQKAVSETEKQLKQDTPEEHDRSPMEALGSSASMIAIFGSLLTRRPFVNALNAAAGVMNAYRAQDQHAFDRQLEIYKLNMDNAKALYSLQKDTYQSILEATDLNDKEKIAKFNATAAAFKDETIPLMGGLKEIENQLRFRDAEMEKAREADNRYRAQQDATNERYRANQDRLQLDFDKLQASQDKTDRTLDIQGRRVDIADRTLQEKSFEVAEKGWKLYQDPKTGKTYQFNPITHLTLDMANNPVAAPEGLVPISSGSSAANLEERKREFDTRQNFAQGQQTERVREFDVKLSSAADQQKERIRQFNERMAAIKATKTDKWQLYTDPATKKTVRYNLTTDEATDMNGNKIVAPDAVSRIATGAQAAVLSEDALNNDATRYRMLGQMPPFGSSGTGQRVEIQNKAAAQMKEMGISPAEQVALQAELKSDVGALNNITRISTSAENYENTALENMKIVKELIPEGVGSDFGPAFNRWLQTGKMEFGSAKVSRLATALITVANEYAKVMSGSTGAQGSTVDSRKEAAELLNVNLAPDQMLGNMNIMARDMENKKRTYANGRETLLAAIRETSDPVAAASGALAPPKVGDIEDGHRYKGGDPKKQENWEAQ